MTALLAAVSAWGQSLPDRAEFKDWSAVAQAIHQNDPSLRDVQADGMSALHWAVFHGHEATVDLLLQAGADRDAVTHYGIRPLAIACNRGDTAIVRRLLQAEVDLEARGPNYETPLMIASRQGNSEVVELLLSSGAKVDVTDQAGQSALMWASAAGHVSVVKRLLANGADPSRSLASGFTALHFAARHGRIGVLEVLVKAGVDVDLPMQVKNRGGRNAAPNSSALILAVESAHFEAALRLVDLGADPNDQRSGHAPLHILSWVRKPRRSDGTDGDPSPRGSGSVGALEFVKQMVEKGANVNLRIDNGRSPGKAQLHSSGATPLLYAAKTADLPLIKTLIQCGADLHIDNIDGCTPLLAAAGVGIAAVDEEAGTEDEVLEVLEYLLSLGAELTVKTKRGDTAMHGAAFRAHPKVVEFLYRRGLESSFWNHQNELGWSPFDIADGKRPGSVKPNSEVRSALSATISR